jgi:tyrosyl-DNA phosphodiesterase 2
MGRTLIVAELRPDEAGPWKALLGVVATVHLESLNSAPMRAKQLAVAHAALATFPNAVLCGDFNFDDVQEWGDWNSRTTTDFAPSDNCAEMNDEVVLPPTNPIKLENGVLERALPDYADLWSTLRPRERGLTFDGKANGQCVRDPDEQMRYDRVMLKARQLGNDDQGQGEKHDRETGGRFVGSHWEGRSIEILGTTAINEIGVRISDHYGLLTVLRCS